MSSIYTSRAEKEKEKGNNAIKNKNYREALSYYKEAINFDPNDSTIYYNRALAYIRLSDYVNAVNDCNKAISLNKQYFKCYERRALAYFHLKEFEKAANDAIFVLQVEPNSNDTRRILNDANKQILQMRQTLKFNELSGSDDDEEDFIDDDVILFDSSEIVEKKIRILEKNSGDIEDYMEKGDYFNVVEGCIESLQVISEIFTKKNNKIENRRYFFAKSYIKSQIILMQFDQAIRFIEEFKSFEPETVKNYKFNLLEAFVYELQGNYEKSLEILVNSNKSQILILKTISKLKHMLHPDTTKPLISPQKLQNHLKNWNYSNEKAKNFFKENKFEISIQEFDKIFRTIVHEFSDLEIISDSQLKQLVITILNNKAIANSKIKNFHESNKICLQVLKFERNQPKAYYWLGKNLLELKFYKQAKDWLNASLTTNPDNKAAICEIQKIDENLLRLNGDSEVFCKSENLAQGSDEISEIKIEDKIEEKIEENIKDKIEEKIEEKKVESEFIELENIENIEINNSNEEQENENDDKVHVDVELCIDEEFQDEFEDIDLNENSEENIESIEKSEPLNTIPIVQNQEPLITATSSTVPPAILSKETQDQELLITASSNTVPSASSSKEIPKILNLSLAKQYAELESSPAQLTGKSLVASLDQIMKSQTLLLSIKSIPPEDYHYLLNHVDRFFPALVSELASYDNSSPFEPFVTEFLYSISKTGSFKVVLKFLTRPEKSSLTQILSKINDPSLIELFTLN